MPLIVFFLALLSFLNASQILYVMPYEQNNAFNDLIDSIQVAQKNIKISIFSFTNREIAKSLKNAAFRGVKIKIIYDYKENKTDDRSTIGYLSKFQGIQTCLLEGLKARNQTYHGIMHQKLAIIDDRIIFLGSANWSKNAFQNNYELLLKSNDTDIITKANDYFDKMFSICKPY